MGDEQTIAEIERRKQRAKDLKIREVLWTLYRCFSDLYPMWRSSRPDLIYPGFSQSGPEVSDKGVKFSLGPNNYEIRCRKQPSRKDYERGITQREEITDGTLALSFNGEGVFKFEWSQCTSYTHDGPFCKDHLGEITRFIDGPWVPEVVNLLGNITEHEERSGKNEMPIRKR